MNGPTANDTTEHPPLSTTNQAQGPTSRQTQKPHVHSQSSQTAAQWANEITEPAGPHSVVANLEGLITH